MQITPLRPELPIDAAAGAIEMSRDELRHYVSKGEIPLRSSEYVDWVNLADVLAFDSRLEAQRAEGLRALSGEEALGRLALNAVASCSSFAGVCG